MNKFWTKIKNFFKNYSIGNNNSYELSEMMMLHNISNRFSGNVLVNDYFKNFHYIDENNIKRNVIFKVANKPDFSEEFNKSKEDTRIVLETAIKLFQYMKNQFGKTYYLFKKYKNGKLFRDNILEPIIFKSIFISLTFKEIYNTENTSFCIDELSTIDRVEFMLYLEAYINLAQRKYYT